MSIERLQAGAQSATFYTFSEVEDDSLLTTAEWVALPDGKLKRLLNTTYLNGEGETDSFAFMRAYATAGGMTVINRLGNALSGSADDQWSLSPGGEGFPAKGTPMLNVAFYVNGGTSVRISVSYSASE